MPKLSTLLVMAIGLILVLIFSWVYEFTTDGLLKESEIDYDKVTSVPIRHKFDILIIGLLVFREVDTLDQQTLDLYQQHPVVGMLHLNSRG